MCPSIPSFKDLVCLVRVTLDLLSVYPLSITTLENPLCVNCKLWASQTTNVLDHLQAARDKGRPCSTIDCQIPDSPWLLLNLPCFILSVLLFGYTEPGRRWWGEENAMPCNSFFLPVMKSENRTDGISVNIDRAYTGNGERGVWSTGILWYVMSVKYRTGDVSETIDLGLHYKWELCMGLVVLLCLWSVAVRMRKTGSDPQ